MQSLLPLPKSTHAVFGSNALASNNTGPITLGALNSPDLGFGPMMSAREICEVLAVAAPEWMLNGSPDW